MKNDIKEHWNFKRVIVKILKDATGIAGEKLEFFHYLEEGKIPKMWGKK